MEAWGNRCSAGGMTGTTMRNGFRGSVRWTGIAVAAVLVAAVLAGCAGLPPGAQAPSVTIADFGIGNAGLFEQQFDLKLRIQNPNPEEFRVDGIAFELEINDQLFARGVGNQAVTVPRYGSGFMQVEAVSTLGSLVKQFARVAQDGKPVFKYRIKGSLSIAAGARLPFDERGEFDFRALTSKP
jgi:LEA14-like dessication related protein